MVEINANCLWLHSDLITGSLNTELETLDGAAFTGRVVLRFHRVFSFSVFSSRGLWYTSLFSNGSTYMGLYRVHLTWVNLQKFKEQEKYYTFIPKFWKYIILHTNNNLTSNFITWPLSCYHLWLGHYHHQDTHSVRVSLNGQRLARPLKSPRVQFSRCTFLSCSSWNLSATARSVLHR